MAIGIRGFAAIIAVAALMVIGVACGNGAEPTSLSDEVPTPADYVSLVDNLRAAGATVDPAGTVSADYFAPQGQLLTVNGGRVETFEFASAEEADAAAGGVSATGSSIVTTMADGTQKASMITWVAPPHYYKAGKLIVLYVGCDSDVINILQETMGPQFAGGAGVSQCPEQVPPTTPIVSHGGPVKDYVSLVDNLRAAGATVDPAGTESADFLAPQTQVLTVNGERVETFEFASAEEADTAAEGVSPTGSTIRTTMADGTQTVTSVLWVAPPHYYKAGRLIALYVGSDDDVIDALQDAMGPQFAEGPPRVGGKTPDEVPTPAPPTVGGTTPDEVPTPAPPTGEATTAPPAPAPASAPASASSAPRPGSVKEFAAPADVIVEATISSVLAEKMLGPYGEDGTALPADEETGWPITDYLVQIESVLKADDVVAGADTLVLRVFGYLSRQGQGPAGGPTYSTAFEMPNPGDHLLFVLRRNPDGTYGSIPGGFLDIDGTTVAFADGFLFPFEMAPAQFMDEIRDEVSRLAALDPGLLEPLLGLWKGVLGPSGREAENMTLREAENMSIPELLEEGLELISFEFWIEQDGVHGLITTPGRGSELVDLRFELPIVHFESSGSGTVFDGELEGDTISGTATLRGQSSPFSLERNKFPSDGGDRR